MSTFTAQTIMTWYGILLLVSLLTNHDVEGRDQFWYPVYDGCSKIETLSASQFDIVTKATGVSLVAFLQQPLVKDEDSMFDITNGMVDAVAPQLSSDGIKIYKMDISGNSEVLMQAGEVEAGDIHLYVDGEKRVFRGYQTPESLLAFVTLSRGPAVQLISDKPSKKLYENVYTTKVLAYLDFISPVRQVYRDIASRYYPSIHFYEINDPTIASDMIKEATLGTVQLKRPYEKHAEVMNRDAMLSFADDLVQFLDNSRRPLLQTVSILDLQDIWHDRPEQNFVVAFTKHKSTLHKLLQGRIKYLKDVVTPPIDTPQPGDSTTAEDVVVDPDPCVRDQPIAIINPETFPQLTGHWHRLFQVNLQEPQLALLNRTDLTAAWFDITQLTTLTSDDERKAAIGQWICDIREGRIRVDGLEPTITEQTTMKEVVEDILAADQIQP